MDLNYQLTFVFLFTHVTNNNNKLIIKPTTNVLLIVTTLASIKLIGP